MNLWLIIVVIHTTRAVVKLKPEKNSGWNGIRIHDLCDTGAVLDRPSYQATCGLVTL